MRTSRDVSVEIRAHRRKKFLARRRRAQAKTFESVRARIAQSDVAFILRDVLPENPALAAQAAKTRAKANPVAGPNAEAWGAKRFADLRRSIERRAAAAEHRVPLYGMGALVSALLATANAPHERDGDLVE